MNSSNHNGNQLSKSGGFQPRHQARPRPMSPLAFNSNKLDLFDASKRPSQIAKELGKRINSPLKPRQWSPRSDYSVISSKTYTTDTTQDTSRTLDSSRLSTKTAQTDSALYRLPSPRKRGLIRSSFSQGDSNSDSRSTNNNSNNKQFISSLIEEEQMKKNYEQALINKMSDEDRYAYLTGMYALTSHFFKTFYIYYMLYTAYPM